MIGVVLAGGASKRMGRDKSTVELAGTPLIAWVVGALESVCSDVVIAGRDWEGRRRLDDHPDFKGPLAGLAAALEMGDDVLLVAVDQPWLRPATLQGLAARAGTAVPVDDGVPQVTCARFDRAVDLSVNDGSLQSIVSPQDHIGFEAWSRWGEDGRSWFSIDTPADLEAGVSLYGPPGKSDGPLA